MASPPSLLHRDLERNPRPCRRLLEDHRERLAFQRPSVNTDAAFEGNARIYDAPEIRGIDQGQLKKCRGAAVINQFSAAVVENRDRLPDMRLFSDQWRQQAKHVVTCQDRQKPAVESSRSEIGIRDDAFQTPHHTRTARFGDNRRVAGRQGFQLRLHEFAHGNPHAAGTLLQHHVEHGVGDRGRQRVASERAAVSSGGDPFAASAVARHAPIGKPPPRPFGGRHDVRLDSGPFVCPEPARPSHAGLHLVDHQKQAQFVAQSPEIAEKSRVGRADAALSLHGLDHDARRFAGYGRANLVHVSESYVIEPSTGGPNPARWASLPPAAMVASVRPWKLPSKDIRR